MPILIPQHRTPPSSKEIYGGFSNSNGKIDLLLITYTILKFRNI
jgi:hypothetical protein